MSVTEIFYDFVIGMDTVDGLYGSNSTSLSSNYDVYLWNLVGSLFFSRLIKLQGKRLSVNKLEKRLFLPTKDYKISNFYEVA